MMPRMPTVAEAIRQAEIQLRASPSLDHWPGKARVEAEVLLEHALGRTVDPGAPISEAQGRRFRALVERRVAGEPAAYITGLTEFAGMFMRVGPGAFIPRESSEFMAVQAVKRLRGRRDPVHVDLATGVGPVALAVAAAVPRVRVFGVDLSAKPVAFARRNARDLGLDRVAFLRGDLFGPVPADLRGRVDVVTVHPPYVGRREVRTLPEEIRRFEPMESLTDRSPAGMGLIERTAAEAPAWLRPGGWLLVEVSPDRSRAVAAILRRAGYAEVRSTKGPIRVSRVLVARRRR
jgi:release factor glutamine methyltransferase